MYVDGAGQKLQFLVSRGLLNLLLALGLWFVSVMVSVELSAASVLVVMSSGVGSICEILRS